MPTFESGVVPNWLPQRAECICTSWLDFKGYGFLANPDPQDKRDIFVHVNVLPDRERRQKKLEAGDVVVATFVELPDKRLRATKIEFVQSQYQT